MHNNAMKKVIKKIGHSTAITFNREEIYIYQLKQGKIVEIKINE